MDGPSLTGPLRLDCVSLGEPPCYLLEHMRARMHGAESHRRSSRVSYSSRMYILSLACADPRILKHLISSMWCARFVV